MTELDRLIQAKADKLYPPNHLVPDPHGETGVANSDEYGYEEYANKAFVAGAEFRRTIPPTEEEIEKASRAGYAQMHPSGDWEALPRPAQAIYIGWTAAALEAVTEP